MSLLAALLLGIIQGVTEFFPVSSSSHLKLAKILLGLPQTSDTILFDLTCHFGTVCALLIYFRKSLLELVMKPREMLPYIIASLPLIPGYFLLKSARDTCSDLRFLGFFLMITSLILFCGHFFGTRRAPKESTRVCDYLTIGTMQALALFPGISRSGATISAAQICGWSPAASVTFSFILSIPAVTGGLLLESYHLQKTNSAIFLENLTPCLIGFFTSFIIGLMALGAAMRLLSKSGQLKYFAWYCLILGITVAIWLNL